MEGKAGSVSHDHRHEDLSGGKQFIYNWGRHEGPVTPVKTTNQVEIDDETLRDGLQGTQLEQHPTGRQKISYLINAMPYINHADIGFPASGPEHFAELDQIVKYIASHDNPITLSAAGRASAPADLKGIIDLSAVNDGYPVEADLFLDGSRYRALKQGWDRLEMFRLMAQHIAVAKAHGLPVMFVPERATDTPPEELLEVCKIALDAGADRICIADTRGIAGARGIQNIFRFLIGELHAKYTTPSHEIKWDGHFHNDRDLAISNCLVAAEEGVDRIHATIFCIGERSGNVDLAKLLLNLNLAGFRDDDLSGLLRFLNLMSDLLHYAVSPNTAVYGSSAHKTASGVHGSGEKAGNDIYHAYPPELVGAKPGVEIGPFSGMANVDIKLRELGIEATQGEKQAVLDEAKNSFRILNNTTIEAIIKGANGRHRD